VPDHSTLARAYRRLLRMRVLDPMRQRLLIARAELVATVRLDRLFDQRWKAETGHAVIKRTLGDALRSRRVMLQKREPAVKGLVYNLHR